MQSERLRIKTAETLAISSCFSCTIEKTIFKVKNINIDGNIENNTNTIHGIEFTSDVYHDTFSLLDNIEIYNCTGNGVHITGSYQKSSIRELKISNVNVLINVYIFHKEG